MNPEYYQQAQRLQEVSADRGVRHVRLLTLRAQLRSAQQSRQQTTAYSFSGGNGQNDSQYSNDSGGQVMENEPLQDPLIFPGVYAPSGFNIMDILVRRIFFF
jgi:hypothetical protein